MVGYLGGYALISFDHLFPHKSAGTEQSTSTVSLYHALHADTVEDGRLLEWEPITGEYLVTPKKILCRCTRVEASPGSHNFHRGY